MWFPMSGVSASLDVVVSSTRIFFKPSRPCMVHPLTFLPFDSYEQTCRPAFFLSPVFCIPALISFPCISIYLFRRLWLT